MDSVVTPNHENTKYQDSSCSSMVILYNIWAESIKNCEYNEVLNTSLLQCFHTVFNLRFFLILLHNQFFWE